ncbi:hypothetical protein V1511DRAFT_190068 [Dipodascopsis uninucleata]
MAYQQPRPKEIITASDYDPGGGINGIFIYESIRPSFRIESAPSKSQFQVSTSGLPSPGLTPDSAHSNGMSIGAVATRSESFSGSTSNGRLGIGPTPPSAVVSDDNASGHSIQSPAPSAAGVCDREHNSPGSVSSASSPSPSIAVLSRPQTSKRTARACVRCRKQKLKCDSYRPCALCVRANVECVNRPDEPANARSHPIPTSGHNESKPLKKQKFNASSSLPSVADNVRGLPPSDDKGTFAGSPNKIALIPYDPLSFRRQRTVTLISFLPPKEVVDYVVNFFFETTSWFIPILSKNEILDKMLGYFALYERNPGLVPDKDEDYAFIVLLIMIVVLGGRYAVVSNAHQRNVALLFEQSRSRFGTQQQYNGTSRDLGITIAHLLSVIRSDLVDILSCSSRETVLACFLLASFYFAHGDPNLTWSLLGNIAKMAYAAEIGSSTRMFWELYGFDHFVALSFGRPTSFPSTFVPIDSTFQFCRARLLTITSDIMTSLYEVNKLPSNHSVEFYVENVKRLERDLAGWHDDIVRAWSDVDELIEDQEGLTEPLNERALQLFLLDLAFDNAIIMLYRPLIDYSDAEVFDYALDKCWKAAVRTSNISKGFAYMQNTYAAAFIAIYLFTAGVVLSVIGSSEPLSDRALESKRGLARIIHMEKIIRKKSSVAETAFQILEHLARITVQREVDKILAGGVYLNVVNSSEESSTVDHNVAVVLTNMSSIAKDSHREAQSPVKYCASHGDTDRKSGTPCRACDNLSPLNLEGASTASASKSNNIRSEIKNTLDIFHESMCFSAEYLQTWLWSFNRPPQALSPAFSMHSYSCKC